MLARLVRVLFPRGPWAAALRGAECVGIIATYTSLTWLAMYPLFLHPASEVVDPLNKGGAGILGLPDVKMSVWVLAWVWRALRTDPGNLFNANMFHPAPNLLAAAEHVIGQQPIFGTVCGLTGNPVLAYQLDILFSISLCGAAMYALLRHWSVSRAAAFFGGFVYALFPARTHYGPVSIQTIAVYYLPLVVLYLDRVLVDGRVRHAASLGFLLLMQMLCGYYVAYMTLLTLAAYGLGVLIASRGRLNWKHVGAAALAAGLACAAMGVLSLPYLERRNLGAIREYIDPVRLMSSSSDPWRNFVLPPLAVREWGWSLRHGLMLYLGLVPALSAMLLLRRHSTRPARVAPDWAVTACLAALILCWLLALGPQIDIAGIAISGPYALFLKFVPGFSSMRSPARFGFLLIFGFAALAGMGFDRLLQRLAGRRGRRVVVTLVALVATAFEYDYFRFRFATESVPTNANLPPVYRVLGSLSPGPVLELPIHSLATMDGMVREINYVYFAAFHGMRLLNGYSQYPPASADPVLALAAVLPEARAVRVLRRATGVRYIIVHRDELSPSDQSRWSGNLEDEAGLRLISQYGSDLLYEVDLVGVVAGDLIARLTTYTPVDTTILGVPIRPVPIEHRAAEIAVAGEVPSQAVAVFNVAVDLLITNRGGVTWPALATVSPGLVKVAYRWQAADGSVVLERLDGARLPYDLAPGESTRVRVWVSAPPRPGVYSLVLGLAQDGSWFPQPLPGLPVTVRYLSTVMNRS